MAVNFTLAQSGDKTKSGTQQPVLSAKAIKCVDQAATGSWAVVNFGSYTNPPSTRGLLVHVVPDVAIRYGAGTAQPTDVGSLIPAGSERTLALDVGQNLYIKTA